MIEKHAIGRALLMVVAVWAAIYLPALGSLEIKGEEGRRILPAITMMETHNYIVPEVGGDPYLRKPPLVNWLVAMSFRILGVRNEWSARLPSALMVLAVAIAFVTVARASLGPTASITAALIWLTSFGIVEKGRLIEIEALYVSLFALAFIFWLTFYEQKRSKWLTWTLPWFFLGLGWLGKGPQHLLFFYAIIAAILVKAGDLRKLWSFLHVIGVLLMLSIFAAWAIPALLTAKDVDVTAVWARQFAGRLTGREFEFVGWVQNVPRGIVYFLPWVILLPLVGGTKFSPDKRDIIRGLGLGILPSFGVMSLLPGSLPRYAMPLLAPAAWLLAMVLTSENLRWPGWVGGAAFSGKSRDRFVVGVVITTCVCMLVYALAVVPYLQSRQKVRPLAAQIENVVPEGETLYAVKPDFQPFLFYLRRPLQFVNDVEDLPAQTRYFFIRAKHETKVDVSRRWSERKPRAVLRLTDYRDWKITVYAVE